MREELITLSDLCMQNKLDIQISNSLILRWSEAGCLESAEYIFNSIKRKNTQSYNNMIMAYNKHKEYSASYHLYITMSNNIRLNINTYNMIIIACINLGKLDDIDNIITQMKTSSKNIPTKTKRRIISQCAKNKSDTLAVKIFNSIDYPDIEVSKLMLGVYFRLKEYDKFIEIVKRVREIQPDIDEKAMNLCVKFKNSEIALRLLHVVTQNIKLYNMVIFICSYNKDYEKACQVFKNMTVSPDLETFENLIYVCGICNQYNLMCFYADKLNDYNLKATCKIYNSLMSGCINKHKFQNAIDMFMVMKKENIEFNTLTYNLFLTACKNAQQYDLAIEYWDGLSVNRDTITFNTMMGIYLNIKKYDMVISLYNEMKFFGVAYDIMSYNTIISAYRNNGEYNSVIDIFEEMKSNNIRYNDIVTNKIILSTFEISGRYEEGLHFIGYPDIILCNDIVDNIINLLVLLDRDYEALNIARRVININNQILDFHQHDWGMAYVVTKYCIQNRKRVMLITGYGATTGKHKIRDQVHKILHSHAVKYQYAIGRFQLL